VLVELLKKYDLITAIDGKTALEAANSEDIDLILLDIMMPDMDGFEVCNILKSNKKTSNIPIIFLTALDKQEDLQQGFKLGAVDYITKPFNPKELLSRVNTHLTLRAYEKNLALRIEIELEKNRLKQEMIYQKSKQAALGELLMHIAHQWKQPLASLSALNISQKIKIEQDLETTKDENLARIEKSQNLINFMSNTVETFRNFYLPSHSSETFSLTDSVKKVLDISDATLKYNKINILISSDETGQTYGNENEFTQIVFSIINNARDIFKKREIKNPEIKIDIQNNVLTISDNGGGIDNEIIDNIFLPYESSTNSSGIGLYIAKEIAEKNNGYISASNDEKGAVFRVEFLK
jgi:two-component system sensor histidine kinase/response regulator